MTTTTLRAERIEQLATMYPGDWTPDRDGCPTEELTESRYVRIMERDAGGNADTPRSGDYWISAASSTAQACHDLSSDVFEGWIPVGIVDLDTGESIGVHIDNPRVTTIGREGAPPTPWDDGRRFTAQLVDPDNTARCATVIVAGHAEADAREVARLMAHAVAYHVADLYPTPPS